MSGDDWLDEGGNDYPTRLPPATPDPEQPSDAEVPGLPVTIRGVDAAIATMNKRAQLLAAWGSLTDGQRVFLNTWRECRFNAARVYRVLRGTIHAVSKATVNRWLQIPEFDQVRELLRTASIEEILSRDYLAARQEDIVETLLTPKPVLHQGVATGHYEVEAGAAGKANETLLKLGGHLKDKDIDVNIGLVGPSLVIQVVQPDNTVIDVTPRGVPIALPEPESEDWLDGV